MWLERLWVVDPHRQRFTRQSFFIADESLHFLTGFTERRSMISSSTPKIWLENLQIN